MSAPTCGAQLGQERVRLELAPERRRAAVTGVHDRVGPEPLEQPLDRVEQRLPVAAGKVDASDRTGEEEVAGEEVAAGAVGDVAGGVTRRVDRLEVDPAH